MNYNSMSAFCPQCRQQIATARLKANPIVCDGCGFVCSENQHRAQLNLSKTNLIAGIVTSIVLVAGFFQFGAWGSYALEVIPLQMGEVVGLNSTQSTERLAQISLEVKKYNLTETLYLKLSRNSPENLLRLAKFRISRGQLAAASESLKALVIKRVKANNAKASELNVEARYLLAKTLGDLGKTDESIENYEFVLKSKPAVRQVTVLSNYIRMLMAAERFEQARFVIERVRRQDQNARTFMETEYKVILARASDHHS